MATSCCTSCGMAVRASVDNCAAGAEAAAANKIAGIETLRNDFNKSILQLQISFYPLGSADVPSRPAWLFTSLPARPWDPQGGAPESWFADRTQSIDASTRSPAHRQPREAGR